MDAIRKLCTCCFKPRIRFETRNDDEESAILSNRLIGDGTVATAESEKDISVKADFLADANMSGDDRDKITKKELKKLDRYQKFEHYFPFYLMDINGYNLLLKTARVNTYKDANPPIHEYNVKDIAYAELKDVFKNHESWNDLNDENSELMKFLKETCLYEGSPAEGADMRFSSHMLRIIGLLWCEGDTEEKVVEFFDNLQDNN